MFNKPVLFIAKTLSLRLACQQSFAKVGSHPFKANVSSPPQENKELNPSIMEIKRHLKYYFNTDQKNLEILKENLFRVYLSLAKKGKPSSNSTDFSEIKEILNETDSKMIRVFLENEKMRTGLERQGIDLLKTAYLFRSLGPIEFYNTSGRLLNLYILKSINGFQRNPISINKLITLLNISLNRLIVTGDASQFEKLREKLIENLDFCPFEALVSINVNLSEGGLREKYGFEVSEKRAEKMASDGNYEKLALALVRLNKSGLDADLQSKIKGLLMKNIEKLDSKTVSLLISSNFMHKELFSDTQVSMVFKALETEKGKTGFLELSMILVALNKGKALFPQRMSFLVNELRGTVERVGKTAAVMDLSIINYHSIVTILSVFAQYSNKEEDIGEMTPLFKDLCFILNKHHLKGISQTEVLTLWQSTASFLRNLRKLKTDPSKTTRAVEELRHVIEPLLTKLPLLKPSKENPDPKILTFSALMQLKESPRTSQTLESLISGLKNLSFKGNLTLFSSLLELTPLESKSVYESRFLEELLQRSEIRLFSEIQHFFLNYPDALSLLIVVSSNREQIRNKSLFNKIEELYIERIRSFSAVENSYLAFPLVKFAIFNELEIRKIEEFYSKAIFLQGPENPDVLLYNVLTNFTQENQFSPPFFLKFEEFLEKRVILGDLRTKLQLKTVLKIFSVLGRYEIQSRSLIRTFLDFCEENKGKIGLFEWMNILNVILLNGITESGVLEKVLRQIEGSIGEINIESGYFLNYLSLAQVLVETIKLLFAGIDLDKYPRFLGFSRQHYGPLSKEKNSRQGSIFQRTFGNLLREIGVEYSEEKQIGPFEVDFFIKPDLCVEINGRNHYINGRGLNRSTERKYRVLEKQGYKIRTLSPEIWNTIEKEPLERKKSKIMTLLEKGITQAEWAYGI